MLLQYEYIIYLLAPFNKFLDPPLQFEKSLIQILNQLVLLGSGVQSGYASYTMHDQRTFQNTKK